VFFVKVQPALWRGGGGCSFRLLLLLGRRRCLDRLARQIAAALRQHVSVAAGIFDPAAVTLGHDH